jgi:hypothetical protein
MGWGLGAGAMLLERRGWGQRVMVDCCCQGKLCVQSYERPEGEPRVHEHRHLPHQNGELTEDPYFQ